MRTRAGCAAELSGAEFITIEGGGHNPLGRYPARVQHADQRLSRSTAGHCRHPAGTLATRASAKKRVLYLSSPIGLGHGRRDIAITRELRKLHPGLQVDWLAQDPVTRLLEAAASASILSARGLPAKRSISSSKPASTNSTAFQAIRRMDEVLIANFMIFQDAVEQAATTS